jgi:hypothetical protein
MDAHEMRTFGELQEMTDDNGYRKDNYCPYCGYFCDAATMIEDPRQTPKPGDLSFCIMCCSPGQFDDNLVLQKFDLDSITDRNEKNRLLAMQAKMVFFWTSNLPKDEDKKRREGYLKTAKDRFP